ncbi:hypothetical protein DZA21_11280 [Pseudomonas aeruginosa]|nr:hypothetical protein DZA21_11280 [Pseudomonas aeruginosa]
MEVLAERLPTDVEFAGELSFGLAGRCPQCQGRGARRIRKKSYAKLQRRRRQAFVSWFTL